MKKTHLYYALAATAAFAAAPTTATAAITSLNATDGVYFCPAGGTYPVCNYSAVNVVAGTSYFSMDNNGDSIVQNSEKVAIDALSPYVFSDTTAATGSHAGAINGTESPVSDIWEFFGGTGMHYLTAPMVDNGDGTIDMSGWTVTWNGIAAIPMGGDSANFAGDTGLANITCGVDCSVGDTYSLSYAAHVPLGDASGFGGVGYALSLYGTVNTVSVAAVPVPAAVWLFGSGLLGLVGVARRKKQA